MKIPQSNGFKISPVSLAVITMSVGAFAPTDLSDCALKVVPQKCQCNSRWSHNFTANRHSFALAPEVKNLNALGLSRLAQSSHRKQEIAKDLKVFVKVRVNIFKLVKFACIFKRARIFETLLDL
jgi:hypothetical protein